MQICTLDNGCAECADPPGPQWASRTILFKVFALLPALQWSHFALFSRVLLLKLFEIIHFGKFHRFCLLVFAKVYSSTNSFPSSNRLACARSGGVEEDKRMPWAKRHRELQLNEVTFPPTHKSSHAPRKRRKTIAIMNVKCPRIMR